VAGGFGEEAGEVVWVLVAELESDGFDGGSFFEEAFGGFEFEFLKDGEGTVSGVSFENSL